VASRLAAALLAAAVVALASTLALAGEPGPMGGSGGVVTLRYALVRGGGAESSVPLLYEAGDALRLAVRVLNLSVEPPVEGYALYMPASRPGSHLAEECVIASRNASLEARVGRGGGVGLVGASVRLDLEGGVVGYCKFFKNTTSSGEALARAASLLSRLGINLSGVPHAVPETSGYILGPWRLVVFYLGPSFSLSVEGYVNESDWGFYANGTYWGDWPFTLPGGAYNYTVLIPVYERTSVSMPSGACSARPAGLAHALLVNMSARAGRSYTVAGLGTIERHDTAVATPFSDTTLRLAAPEPELERLAERLAERFNGTLVVERRDGVLVAYSKRLAAALEVLRETPRAWRLLPRACNNSLAGTLFLGVRLGRGSVAYHALVEVGGEAYSPLTGDLMVYSVSYRVLLEARWADAHGGLVLPRPPTGGSPQVSLQSLQGGELGLVLVEARGLAPPARLALSVRAPRSWALESGGYAAIVAAAAAPLAGARRRRLYAAVFLIAVGLSLAALAEPKVRGGSDYITVGGQVSGNLNLSGSIVAYIDSGDSLGFTVVASPREGRGGEGGGCGFRLAASARPVAGGAGAGSSGALEVWGRSYVDLNVSSPRLYTLTITVGRPQCGTAQVDARGILVGGARPPRELGALLWPSLAFLAAGLALLAAPLGRGPGGGGPRIRWALVDWHLRSSYLNLAAPTLSAALVAVYSLTPLTCKLGGSCLGPSAGAILALASRLPGEAYTLLALYSSVAAAILFAYHIEAGLDGRLELLGVTRPRALAAKAAVLVALTSLPYAAARAGLYFMVDPAAAYHSLHRVALGALAGGALVALVYGGLTALVSVALGRTSYTLLLAAPLTVAMADLGLPAPPGSVAEGVVHRALGLHPHGLHGVQVALAFAAAVWAVAAALYLRPRRGA